MFKNILTDLLNDKGINQRRLAIEANIPPTTISGWLNADRLPDYSAIKKLSIYFNVSSDYLLELEDEFGNKMKFKNNVHITNNNGNINFH